MTGHVPRAFGNINAFKTELLWDMHVPGTGFNLQRAVFLLGNRHGDCGRIKGDGNIITKEITIEDYNQLEIELNNVELIYKQSKEAPFLKIDFIDIIQFFNQFNDKDIISVVYK